MRSDVETAQGAIATARNLMQKNDPLAAISALEKHIGTLDDARPEVTIGVYIRLASLYRMFERYADEIRLLERFNDLHQDDGQRSRIDARLSKVYARMESSRKAPLIPILVVVRGMRRRRTAVQRRIARRAEATPLLSLS